MATTTSQRVGIWLIAIVLTLGTLGSFLVMALSVQNQSTDDAQLQQVYQEYQDAITAQTESLSAQYYNEFSQYANLPAKFNASDVKELKTKDLKVGDGEVVTEATEYNAYYIGWNPSGVVFDESISENSLKSPIASGGLIEGWSKGVVGMKIGGVRELTIPSDLAYGEAGSGADIPANTPLKFVVMVIPKLDEVPVPQLLLDYYSSLGY
jgi:FKBP-type peptidyl-prolyl cis-trans isomerase FkpA